MSRLILIRHGQSAWNKKNLFTGWVDVPLTNQGIDEALKAGEELKKIDIDTIFVSSLIRAQATAMLVMSRHESDKVPVMIAPDETMRDKAKSSGVNLEKDCIPIYEAWQLNERNYGELQGKNKAEVAEKYGVEQVKIWRRSYDIPPPKGESLKMTADRSVPYFTEHVLPHLKEGKNVLIAAHGNSLRSIAMHLENLSKEEVLNLELPTGKPRYYTFDNGSFLLNEAIVL